jgi:hypothetical protein
MYPRDAHVSFCEGGASIDAVANPPDPLALLLKLRDVFEFLFRKETRLVAGVSIPITELTVFTIISLSLVSMVIFFTPMFFRAKTAFVVPGHISSAMAIIPNLISGNDVHYSSGLLPGVKRPFIPMSSS